MRNKVMREELSAPNEEQSNEGNEFLPLMGKKVMREVTGISVPNERS